MAGPGARRCGDWGVKHEQCVELADGTEGCDLVGLWVTQHAWICCCALHTHHT